MIELIKDSGDSFLPHMKIRGIKKNPADFRLVEILFARGGKFN